ncbi:unnamed protein product, partial [Heterotrigona itama]
RLGLMTYKLLNKHWQQHLIISHYKLAAGLLRCPFFLQ